jgi:hypothetical protein
MNTNGTVPSSRLSPDLDLVELDFASAYADKPEDALARLELLVRDRQSCMGRIAYLRAGAGATGQPFPGPAAAHAGAEFAPEIELLAEGRLFDDFLGGRLSDERVARLHRLTCDVGPLWEAHLRSAAAPQTGPVDGAQAGKASAP